MYSFDPRFMYELRMVVIILMTQAWTDTIQKVIILTRCES